LANRSQSGFLVRGNDIEMTSLGQRIHRECNDAEA
jgi:hypothetical protein